MWVCVLILTQWSTMTATWCVAVNMPTLQEYVRQASAHSTKERSARTPLCAHHKKTQIHLRNARAAGIWTRLATVTCSQEMKSGSMLEPNSKPIIKLLELIATQRLDGKDVVKLNFTTIGCAPNSRLKIMPTWSTKARYPAWRIYILIFQCSKTSHFIATHGED